MSNRAEWTFTMLGSALIDPARTCLAHHTERLAFWEAELETASDNLRANGVRISEPSEASQFATYRGDAHIEIDSSISRRVEQCKVKVREHRGSVAEFDRWVRAFEKNPEKGYDLDIDDMTFFRV